MLWKLLKYDLRAMWKQFSLIWFAALALALVNRFTIDGRNSSSLIGEDTAGLLLMLLGMVFMAMFATTAVFVIQRFYKGLLGDEGYLMHTLPVHAWQLVASKLLCAVLTFTASVAVSFLAMFLMVPFRWDDLSKLSGLFRILLQGAARHPSMLLFVLEALVLLFSCLILGVSMLYLAMALGHLFHRRRALMSTAAFLGLSVLLTQFYVRLNGWSAYRLLTRLLSANDHTALWGGIAVLLLPAAVFLAAVSWILSNRLNLE